MGRPECEATNQFAVNPGPRATPKTPKAHKLQRHNGFSGQTELGRSLPCLGHISSCMFRP